jgi:hypothetical protein
MTEPPQDPLAGPPSGPRYGPPGEQAYEPPPGFGPPGEQAYEPPPGFGAPHQGPQTTSTKALVALVLAVIAWTPVVPFIGAVAALFLAPSARREIQASGGRLTGLGLCRAAEVIAWVHLAFLAFAALALAVVLLLFGASLF